MSRIEEDWKVIKKGISDRYIIETDFAKELLVNGLNNHTLHDYFKIYSGKVGRIKVSGWKFENFSQNLKMSFEKNLKEAIDTVKEVTFPFEETTIARIVEQFHFPVQAINSNEVASEYLAINIVRK